MGDDYGMRNLIPKIINILVLDSFSVRQCYWTALGGLGAGFCNAKGHDFYEGGDGGGYVLTLVFLGIRLGY